MKFWYDDNCQSRRYHFVNRQKQNTVLWCRARTLYLAEFAEKVKREESEIEICVSTSIMEFEFRERQIITNFNVACIPHSFINVGFSALIQRMLQKRNAKEQQNRQTIHPFQKRTEYQPVTWINDEQLGTSLDIRLAQDLRERVNAKIADKYTINHQVSVHCWNLLWLTKWKVFQINNKLENIY